MSYSICNNHIILTKGDSFECDVHIKYPDGTMYSPKVTDTIRFAMKKYYTDKKPLILKYIPVDSMILKLDPEDTSKLSIGSYVFDIEIKTQEGTVSTVIDRGSLTLTEEVY